jgi:hypothetical protein
MSVLRYLVVPLMALADLLIVLGGVLFIGLIVLMELEQAGKFPLCIYAWKEMS